ncbi:MAG: ABC transporter permease [Bacteroidales bacterium]|nr:ABC transporter permease [Bacteroidales bacterium]
MRIWKVFTKSLKEQIRNFWILVLAVSMAPFFVGIYYLIIEASQPQYDIIFVSKDKGTVFYQDQVNFGQVFIDSLLNIKQDTFQIPIKLTSAATREEGIEYLTDKKADALVVFPEDFSVNLSLILMGSDSTQVQVEFIGDLTNIYYLVSAVWAGEILNSALAEVTQRPGLVKIVETGLGSSASINDFDMMVPGLLILGLIMLMFSATIAFISEVEHKTILRLKLSRLRAIEFLTGVSIFQIFVGIFSILLTLVTAIALGFSYSGSLWIVILVAILTSVSIIAFSLILGAVTKTVNEILVVGNFPMFLFMFFTGAAFPMEGKEIFSIAGYPVSLQGLMSPTHAIHALKKVMIMNLEFRDVIPEIVALLILTLIYFIIGVWAFQRRHMRVG